jgi:hypothetical protein
LIFIETAVDSFDEAAVTCKNFTRTLLVIIKLIYK